MGKLFMILMVCVVVAVAMAPVHGLNKGPKAVEEWFKKLSHKKEKLTKLHFFFHDIVSGKNPMAVQVAQANGTFSTPSQFGLIRMMDDPLTVGPEPNSTTVGRAQGFYGATSMEEFQLLMTLNFVFMGREYNGSTLSILGHNPVFNEYRELPIIGGSGVFRLARGVATAQTVWFHVLVMHY